MLTAQQQEWAKAHVGTSTSAIVEGTVTEWVERADGSVRFVIEGDDTVGVFDAVPPYTDDARQRDEEAAQVEADAAQQAAAEAEAARVSAEADALDARIGEKVREIVERLVPTPPTPLR